MFKLVRLEHRFPGTLRSVHAGVGQGQKVVQVWRIAREFGQPDVRCDLQFTAHPKLEALNGGDHLLHQFEGVAAVRFQEQEKFVTTDGGSAVVPT